MAYCSLRNEMKPNETKWKSVVCEMRICSVRNDNLLSRCVYSDILNRKFPPKKPFRRENSDCEECVTFSLPRIKFNFNKLRRFWATDSNRKQDLFPVYLPWRHHNLNFLGENRLGFMPTNIKSLGKVWTILLWITWELVNHFTLGVSELEYFWSVETMKISFYAQARRLPLLQAQSSVWNRLSFLNNFQMILRKFNEIFRVNWTWISDYRASSILKTVPVSQDSKEYAGCKRGEFVHNNTKTFI